MSISDIQIELRDIKPDLVAAWRRHFHDCPSVTVSEGDIFGRTADVIVSPANSFGFMDGGIDLAYSNHFGWQLSEALQDLILERHDGELPVGQAELLPTGHRDIPWMISAPTMRVPSVILHTPNAYLAFRAALRAVRHHNATHPVPIRSLLCPGLGTAIGRLPSEVCAKQMRAAFDAVVMGNKPRFEHFSDAVGWHTQMIRDDL
ncbi:macro domain-containing protein [Deinococcus radiotolerans]|uniref:Macro domain-containing protein n=1 Tax=Deinococcus radiotolerans TaxID=1309407 RepID=A0ABQ2FN01_9DEIO|nr:macro domain-containing protein [Deinococcus radiotolerans]GGL08972.1 hypothetical protein GCM10010844_29620 [Deinococcus radiotolerans]